MRRPHRRPYPGSTQISAQDVLPPSPRDGETARQFLMSLPQDTESIEPGAVVTGFAGWDADKILSLARAVERRIIINRKATFRFGIPRVRGVLFHPTNWLHDSNSIEVPFPGWLLRSFVFCGNANTRDIALFFKLAAICNEFMSKQEIAGFTWQSDADAPFELTWIMPFKPLIHNLFNGSRQRLIASLNRLRSTTITATQDVLCPQKKLKSATPLVLDAGLEAGEMRFTLSRPLYEAILGEDKYAHVNVKTLLSMKSMYGLRFYLLTLGYCAEATWGRSGGRSWIVMPKFYLRSIIAPIYSKPDGEFNRDIVSQIDLDLSRPIRVDKEQEDLNPDTYGGNDRLHIKLFWSLNHKLQEEYRKLRPDDILIKTRVTKAAGLHRSRKSASAPASEMLPTRVPIIDIRVVKWERNANRAEGKMQARVLRGEPFVLPFHGTTKPIPEFKDKPVEEHFVEVFYNQDVDLDDEELFDDDERDEEEENENDIQREEFISAGTDLD